MRPILLALFSVMEKSIYTRDYAVVLRLLTCRRLRQVPGLGTTVIAAVSGYAQEEDGRRSAEAGFDRHLVKPVGRDSVEELVEIAANGR